MVWTLGVRGRGPDSGLMSRLLASIKPSWGGCQLKIRIMFKFLSFLIPLRYIFRSCYFMFQSKLNFQDPSIHLILFIIQLSLKLHTLFQTATTQDIIRSMFDPPRPSVYYRVKCKVPLIIAKFPSQRWKIRENWANFNCVKTHQFFSFCFYVN